MRKNSKSIHFMLILLIITTAFCGLKQHQRSAPLEASNCELQIKADDPFNITQNADFDTYKSQGDGTAGDPYILENYVINASVFGTHGILINNTDAHFILRNCTITDASGYAGILLDNVTHGTLTNNSVLSNTHGILLQRGCHNNTLHNNTAKYNGQHGIWLSESSNNTLRDNLALENYFGIQLSNSCTNNTLDHNTANDNSADGFRLRDNCANNTLVNNIANSNWDYGITLQVNCHDNTLINNTVSYNMDGIRIEGGCDYNNLSHNVANHNDVRGILLGSNCDSNTLTGNTAAFNILGPGIWVTEGTGTATNNDIISNIVVYNGDYGIKVDGDSNYFYRNAIFLNTLGEILDGGSGNTWVENLVNASGDFDGDGLINEDEISWRTDLFFNDTDNDAIPDGWEVDNSLDPLNATDASDDFDLDGLTNLAEFFNGTNATNPDTDGDGYSDGTEVTQGTDPLDPNDYPSEEPINWLTMIIIAIISIAGAIIAYLIIKQARSSKPPKQVPPTSKQYVS